MISFFLTAARLLKALGKAMARPVFQSLLLTLFLILLSGTLFYTQVEGWHVLDAVYFGGVSLSTSTGKIFTMMYLLVGVGIMISLLAMIAKEVINYNIENKQ